jgi:hypothetical protein
MAEITLYDYVALNPKSQKKAIALLKNNGYEKISDPTDLAKKIKHFVHKEGEKAIDKIALIHPDKELIIDVCAKPALKEADKKDFCGCGADGEQFNCAFAGQQFLNTTGKEPTTTTTGKPLMSDKTITIMIFSGVALFGLALTALIIASVKRKKD